MHRVAIRSWLERALLSNGLQDKVHLRSSMFGKAKSAGTRSGDYTCTNALMEAKRCKLDVAVLAQRIVDSLPARSTRFARAQVSSNGFIGFTVSDRWIGEGIAATASGRLVDSTRRLASKQKWSCSNDENDDEQKTSASKIVVDFASPNVAKQLHVGHFRSIVIGDCLSRVLDYCGHRVTRLSHVGDFGLPIGLVLAMQDRLGVADVDDDDALGQLYVDAKALSAQDDAFLSDALRRCRELQAALIDGADDDDDDDDARPIVQRWRRICSASRAMHDRVLGRLGVDVKERGESFYAPMLDDVVATLQERALVTHDGGALVAHFDARGRWLKRSEAAGDDNSRALLVRKRDGGYLYGTTDLAALRHRVSELGADRLIYVTDSGQRAHFGQVFELARRAGWHDESRVRIDHVAFGVVRNADNRKLSSRRGTSREQSLEALLSAATEAARERAPELSADAADHLGLAALRYFDLSHQHTKDYQFDVDRMLSFTGNTAAYLMYAYARLSSLRARFDIADIEETVHDYEGVDARERTLALAVSSLSDIVDDVERTLAPHFLCDYAYRVATAFHQFYQHCRILDAPNGADRARRMQLALATHIVMRQLFALLGIEPLDKM
jgi:arginyl-tRNA synthetase